MIINEQQDDFKTKKKVNSQPSQDEGWIGPNTEQTLKKRILEDGEKLADYDLVQVESEGRSGFYIRKASTPTPQPTPGNNTTFSDDPLLKNLNQDLILKLETHLGITPSSYTDTVDNIRFYKSSKDPKVWLRTDSDLIVLIKNVPGNVEKAKSSEYRLAEFQRLTDQGLQDLFNRVQSIEENKSNMKKILKEEYQKRQTEKEIISKRFNILSESKSAELIISEVNYLQKQKFSESLIKEGLFELIQAMYKDDSDLVPKLKNSYISWISKKLPNESELFMKSLDKSIDDLDDEKLPSLFTDCHQVVEMMYEAILTGMVNDKFDVVGVPKDIEDVLRREIIDNLKQDNMKLKIKAQLVNKICPQYGDLIRNTQKTFDDIKTKLLS